MRGHSLRVGLQWLAGGLPLAVAGGEAPAQSATHCGGGHRRPGLQTIRGLYLPAMLCWLPGFSSTVCAQRARVPHTNPDPIPSLHKVCVREIFVAGAGKAAETMIRQRGESLLCRLETGPGPLQKWGGGGPLFWDPIIWGTTLGSPIKATESSGAVRAHSCGFLGLKWVSDAWGRIGRPHAMPCTANVRILAERGF